ncbi:MAG: 3-isopropylmalate dehydratase small subunit [Nitrosopumilaceae archaeon]|nr:3-isopropylmalate dehydratase small subunit [Nitrosopumilaceae archaeon]
MISRVIAYKSNNIDTDSIIPGKYLKLHEYEELAKHAMEGLDPNFSNKTKDCSFIIAGHNFGCGSSREHAPIALSFSGIKIILALSFARIFYRNAIDGAFIIPVEIDQNTYDGINDGDELNIDIQNNKIKNLTTSKTYSTKPFSYLIKKIIDAGGIFKLDM